MINEMHTVKCRYVLQSLFVSNTFIQIETISYIDLENTYVLVCR